MGLLREKNGIRVYIGVHDSSCDEVVDLSKKYTVCAITKHFSTNDWQEADAKYSEWSGEAILNPFKT